MPHLADYLDAAAGRFPDRVAVIDPRGDRLNYSTLQNESDALGRFLAARVSPGSRVGVVLPKCNAAVVAAFAILKARMVFVPVDYASHERGRRILTDCAVGAVIMDSRCESMLPEGWNGLTIALEHDPGAGRSIERATRFATAVRCEEGMLPAGRSADDLAYIIYTSGSTGTPKGAMITHRSATSFVEWCSSLLEPTCDDRFSSHTPFHFDASAHDLYVAIKHGASLHLISEETAKKPAELARFIAERRLTLWTSTPSALIMLLQYGELSAHDCSTLRAVLFGGEVFPIRQLRELRRQWPASVFYNMYGPTETTTTCTFARIPQEIPDDREHPYPIGFPCAHVRILIADEGGHTTPEGEPGLLYIGGPAVFAGYWQRPNETAASLLEKDGVRWYNTGDVVRWDPVEGLAFVGRRDRMVKRRGYRIELGEVERALASHAAVREVAVVSVAEGESGPKIVAFVCCSTSRPSIVDLKMFFATRLPAYMSPDRFVFQDALPTTSSGKIDYQTLTRLTQGAHAA